MKKKLSEYQVLYHKGAMLSHLNTEETLQKAFPCLVKAVEISATEEAVMELCTVALSLNDFDSFRKYAELGVSLGYLPLCKALSVAYGSPRSGMYDPEKAIYWLEYAAAKGNANACKDLGDYYFSGILVEKNIDKAVDYYKRGLEINDPLSNSLLHYSLATVFQFRKELDKAFDEFFASANLGYKPAFYKVALCYKNGEGVEIDIEKYADYLFKDVNYDTALEIGGLYLMGDYVDCDIEMAEYYFGKAASMYNPIGAIMYAACLVEKGNYDEREVFSALEVAFRSGAYDAELRNKDTLYSLEDFFGEEIAGVLRDLAKKYWNMRENQA